MTMFRVALLAPVAAILLAGVPANAQSDGQLWMKAAAEYGLDKKTELIFEQHLRFDQDITRVASVMPEVGIQREVTRWFRAVVGYRFIYRRENDGDMNWGHRLFADAKFRARIRMFRLQYRARIQGQWLDEKESRYKLRNELEAKLKVFRKWDPYAAAELFNRLDDDDETFGADKLRLTIGTQRDLGKKQAIDVYYRVQLPRRDSSDPVEHIAGLSYQVSL